MGLLGLKLLSVLAEYSDLAVVMATEGIPSLLQTLRKHFSEDEVRDFIIIMYITGGLIDGRGLNTAYGLVHDMMQG